MKKALTIAMVILLLLGLCTVSMNTVAEPALEPVILTQEIECMPTPNWTGGGNDVNLPLNQTKYAKIYKENGMQTGEFQYLVPELSTPNLINDVPAAVWQGVEDNHITRMISVAGTFVVYKFDLADTADDFSVTLKHMSFGFTVEASKDGLAWLPVGTGRNDDLGYASDSTFPEAGNSTHFTNMNTVLQNNPSKTVYIRLTCGVGGRLYYQSVKITSHYQATDESAARLQCRLTPAMASPNSDGRYWLCDAKGIWDEMFLFEESQPPVRSIIWNKAVLASLMGSSDYKTYKFKLDSRAVDFAVGLRAQTYGFVVEISKDNINWHQIWSVTDDCGGMREYAMSQTTAGVSAVLSNNPTKTVYIRVTSTAALLALNRFDFSYSYALNCQNEDLPALGNHLLKTEELTSDYDYWDVNGDGNIDILDLLSSKKESANGFVSSTRRINDIGEDEWKTLSPQQEAFFAIASADSGTAFNDNTLYYIDLRAIVNQAKTNGISSKILRDTVELAAAIQGIVNRDKPHIYVNFVNNQWDFTAMSGGNGKFYPDPDNFWLTELRKSGEYLDGKTVVEIYSVGKLVDLFKDKVNGAVIWDEKVNATSNVASTVSGVENLVPIRYEKGAGVYDWFVRRHKIFKVKRNLVSLFSGRGRIPETDMNSTGSAKNDAYLWAKYHYLDTGKTNPTLLFYVLDAMPWSPVGEPYPDLESLSLVNKDYYIGEKAFFFDLNVMESNVASDDPYQQPGTDYQTLSAILRQQNLNANGEFGTYGGFVPWWIKYTDIVDPLLPGALQIETKSAEVMMSYYMATDAEAAKSMSNASIFKRIPLKTLAQNTKNNGQTMQNKNYIMLYMGDFDSSAWTNSLMPGFFNDPGKNRYPIAWSVSPLLYRKVPHVFNYMYSNKGSKDYFVMANSGAAHFAVEYITNQNRPQGLPGTVADWTNLNQTLASVFDLDVGGFFIDDRTDVAGTFNAYDSFLTLGAAVNQAPPSTSRNGKAYIQAETAIDISTDINHMAPYIGSRLTNVTSARKPSFNVYRCIWTSPTELADAIDRVKSNYTYGNTVEVLDPYTFFRFYRQSLGLPAVY